MANDTIENILLNILIVLVIVGLLGFTYVNFVAADTTLGYITYGTSDQIVDTFAGSGSITVPGYVDVVHIRLPSVNSGNFLVTTGYSDTTYTYTARFWGNNAVDEEVTATYTGSSYAFNTTPTTSGITSQLTDLDIRVYRPTGTSNDLLGTWILPPTITDTSAFDVGYGTLVVGGIISNESQALRFTQIRWSKSSSGINFVADIPDWGEEPIITNNINVYGGTITFDDVSSGEPQRLLTFMQDNAEKEGVNGWSITLQLPSDSPLLSSYLGNLRNRIRTLLDSVEAETNGGMYGWLVNSLNGFFSLDLGLGITLGGVLGAIISLLVVIALLREFAGG